MKTPKRPRDPNQLAKFVIDAVTSEDGPKIETPKVVRARKGGIIGGKARAKVLSQGERSEIARLAAEARWKKAD